MLTCCTCQESGFNRNTLEMHIATQHIFYSAYECEHCKTAQFPSEFALRQHYQQDHRQKTFYIRFRVTPELEKKREILETLIRKSLTNSNSENDGSDGGDGTNMNDTTPGFIPNIDHLEASQLLSCIQAGPSGSSFSALLKYDIDDGESADNSNNDSMLNRNGELANTYSCQLNNINNYVTNSATGKAHVAAVQGLLSINGCHGDQLLQNNHQQNGLNQQQSGPHFIQVHPASNYNGNEISIQSGELTDNGPDLLVKLLTASRQEQIDNSKQRLSPASASLKRPGRISSQIECVDCGAKVSNYMNSLVLHVSTHHCNSPVYECLACNKQWFSLSARFKDHIKSRHDSNFSLLKDNRQAIMPMLKEKAAKLFPAHRFS